MLKRTLTAWLRAFYREQRYTTINISGLVVGLTTCIFIFLWVVDELSWDRFHEDHSRIFQVLENQTYSSGTIETYDGTPAPLAEKLKSDFADVELVSRATWDDQMTITVDKRSILQAGKFVDPDFFKIFTLTLAEGNPERLLATPNSIVITQRMATALFGNQPALGKAMVINGEREVTVTGIMKDLPRTSTLDFDFVLPLDAFIRENADRIGWTNHNLATYVKLRDGGLASDLNAKIKSMLAATNPPGEVIDLFLFRFRDWRLHYNFVQGQQTGGKILYVRAFSMVAAFIMLTACINFINLSTARAARRAREVGVRKVAGASRKDLITQFLGESVLLAVISAVIAILFVYLLTPLFSYVTNKNISLDYTDPVVIFGLIAIVLTTGLVAGSYPAFFLSSFRPAVVLRGTMHQSLGGSRLRNALVVVQFSLSIILVITALVVNQQIRYINDKELGYDRKHILVVPANGVGDLTSLCNELRAFPFVRHVGLGTDIPPNIYNNDEARWSALPEGQTVTVQSTECDEDYINALGFRLVEGRIFSKEIISDSAAFVVNESAASVLGLDKPIGQEIILYKKKGKIIGVVSDFHNRNLYSPIDPVVFVLDRSERLPFAFVRYEPGKANECKQAIADVYKKLQPKIPVEVRDIEEYNNWTYRSEQMTGRLSVCFTVVLLFIAILGLFGLTSYTTERRRKEIGIRKVLGASVEGLVAMFCGEFLRPLAVSLFIGFSVAVYVVQQFLDRFTYSTDPGIMTFLLTGTGMILIALLTVVYQSAAAANANPAETLRAE